MISDNDLSKLNNMLNKDLDKAEDTMRVKKWSVEDNDGTLEFEIEFKDTKDKDVEYTYDLQSEDLLEKED